MLFHLIKLNCHCSSHLCHIVHMPYFFLDTQFWGSLFAGLQQTLCFLALSSSLHCVCSKGAIITTSSVLVCCFVASSVCVGDCSGVLYLFVSKCACVCVFVHMSVHLSWRAEECQPRELLGPAAQCSKST